MDKVVVFADHEIGFQICESLLKNRIDYTIVSIYTSQNDKRWWKNLKELECLKGAKIEYYDPKNTPDILLQEEVDYLLLLSWKYIIPTKLINHIRRCTLNLHYSLLPKHKGVYPVNWAIQEGDVETGVTFHLVNSKIDAGKIVSQKAIRIELTDDALSLLIKLDRIAFELFKQIWANRKNWIVEAKDQAGPDSYHGKADFQETNLIELEKQFRAFDLINLVRAKNFGEVSHAYFVDSINNKPYKIHIKIEEISQDDPVQ